MRTVFAWMILLIIFTPISPFIWAFVFWGFLITFPIWLPIALVRQHARRRPRRVFFSPRSVSCKI